MSVDEMKKEYEKAGGYSHVLSDNDTNHLMIESNKVLSYHKTDEVSVKVKELKQGIDLKIIVKKGVKVSKPIHLCFGVLEEKRTQKINIDMVFEKNSSAKLLAHCVFPNGKKVNHLMNAKIVLKEGSDCEYSEVHFHGNTGEVFVKPVAEVFLGKNSNYSNTFSLLKGIAGKVEFDYTVYCKENSSADLIAKVNTYKDDNVKIIEKALLEGKNSKALLNTRVVLNGKSQAEVVNTLIGKGDDSRGHMDCVEVVNGKKAVARAVPVVEVKNEKSKITHEAAIGSIDKASINTLMSRGLTKKEAVEVVIKGLLS